ncbi:MAG: aminotransferase class V-fold PLP-dependent enzyme, partial [Clostridia bacterium]|nr:aminotransferase class V-fold PLP-dependent enzyme [Clostridia bacterium]
VYIQRIVRAGRVNIVLYLDNAATTYHKPIRVYRDILLYSMFLSANAGRGGHFLSIRAAEKIMETAEELAELFHIEDASRIAFTQNATYALNLAIRGVGDGGHIVATCMDHNSVLRPAFSFCKCTIVEANEYGIVDAEAVRRAIRHNTRLIVCTHVSNVCGSIQPIRKIGKIAAESGIPFLVDAAQSAGCLEIDVKKDNIDLLAFSGHKGLMGPLGTGGLYVSDKIKLMPPVAGGTGSQSESLIQPNVMPDMLQSGTLNTPAIAALASGIQFVKKETVRAILEHERYFAWRVMSELKNMKEITVYGPCNMEMRNGTVCFNIDGMDSGEVAEKLNNDYKIAVRGGWHCAYLAHKALGTQKSGAVRVSFGIFNKNKDISRLVDAVRKISMKV